MNFAATRPMDIPDNNNSLSTVTTEPEPTNVAAEPPVAPSDPVVVIPPVVVQPPPAVVVPPVTPPPPPPAVVVPPVVIAPKIRAFNEGFIGQEKIFSKLDILWVIDNSSSMNSSQQKLANNFSSFITNLQSQKFDYQMAVTTTEAYHSEFYPTQASASNFKMGGSTGYSGVAIMNRNTPNLKDVFIKNVLQGTYGDGDERAFQSIRATLNNKNNSSFMREGSHLAVIVLSDEDDMSHKGSDQINNNSDPNLDSAAVYQTYLQQKKGSNHFSFNAISIIDKSCKDSLYNGDQKISNRYSLLAGITQGTVLSLCSPFGANLDFLSKHIIGKVNSFTLAKVPYQNKISVKINNTNVPQDSSNGWTYEEGYNTLTFHGSFVPDPNAKVSVDYDVLESDSKTNSKIED
jgi:hypothetical protein